MLYLTNGIIYENNTPVEKDILIEGGKIAEIAPSIKPPAGTETINLGGKIVTPGFIDPHVHFRVPGWEYKEDWRTGSAAAAHGGFTTVLDMPNTKPPAVSVSALEEKRQKVAGSSLVNYGFHFGTQGENQDEIKEAENIASLKIFFNPSTGKMSFDDVHTLRHCFLVADRVAVHAEGKMVDLALDLAFETSRDLYLCHISTKEEISAVRRAKARAADLKEKGIRIYCEVSPHHLFLTEDDFLRKEGFCYMKPTLKSDEDQAALWEAVRVGTVDTIGSDHAPHTLEEKISKPWPPGVPGIETTLPLLLNEIPKRRLTLDRIITLCARNPAAFFRIQGKGDLKPGLYADLTVIDMDRVQKVDEQHLFTKCGWSPFKGRELKGWPVMTIVNGRAVFDGAHMNNIYQGTEVRFG